MPRGGRETRPVMAGDALNAAADGSAEEGCGDAAPVDEVLAHPAASIRTVAAPSTVDLVVTGCGVSPMGPPACVILVSARPGWVSKFTVMAVVEGPLWVC